MKFSCFRPPTGQDLDHDDLAPRRVSTISTKRALRRQGTNQSTTSSRSNSSILSLPPCDRSSDSRVEALMMPVPAERQPSRCLRLSQPRTYNSLVSAMKQDRGCRDWRKFEVFGADDIDVRISADEVAARRAASCARKCRQYSSHADMDFIP